MRQKFLRFVADLRFAIITLLAISVCSVIGTVIEQDQPMQVYKTNYPLTDPLFTVLSWDKILRFGLDHVYKTWWFLSLIFLFGVSLLTCTFLQQFPALKIARRCQFFRRAQQFNSLNVSTVVIGSQFTKILSELNKKRYCLFQQKDIVYGYKGLAGRIAPIIVHFSMVLILVGTVISAIFSFKAQEVLPGGEISRTQNILSIGPLTVISNNSVRVNDFWITYTKQGTISQFYSDLSILNDYGSETKRQTSFVNSPLIDKTTYYYQTDWNLIGLRFRDLKNQITEFPLVQPLSNNSKIWLTWIPNSSKQDSGVILILDNAEGYCSVYDNQGLFLGNLELNEKKNVVLSTVFLEILSSTGLQIKSDPGIPIIYSGSFLLMLSALVSYITYSQIWIIRKTDKIILGGNTNRATFDFELEFFELMK